MLACPFLFFVPNKKGDKVPGDDCTPIGELALKDVKFWSYLLLFFLFSTDGNVRRGVLLLLFGGLRGLRR